MTTSKEIKVAERALARQQYIETAKVSLIKNNRFAVVTSEFDENTEYVVEILDDKPVSCGCDDFFWRSKRNPEHTCKHMETTAIALTKTSRPKKVRRSAPRHDVVASLQVAEGTKVGIAQVRKAFAKSNNVHSMPTTCTGNVLDKAA